ncbi:MAG: hypothetical protein ABL873_00650 [Gallionella sp.]
MKNCLLLLLSTNHLHAQHIMGGKIVERREFGDSADDRADFADFLRHIKCPTYLLTDLIEEDFRLEVTPHLTGSNHSALIKRKFDQFYRGTPFQQATVLQRQSTGRRDDEMLFSALTNPSLVTPWVDILLAHKVPLAGIYSVPQISLPLIQDHPSSHLLLITWNKFAGLRETYFSSHRLQISRLTPITKGLNFQDAVAEELGRTYQYLKSLSLLPAGQVLDVRIVGHSNDLIELQTRLPRSEDMRYDFVDLATLAKKLGSDAQTRDSDANHVFLQQLAAKQPKTQYGNDEHTRYFTLWQLRRALLWFSVALFAGSLIWALQVTQLDNTPDQSAVDAVLEQAQRITAEKDHILRALPKTQVSPSDIKAAVTTLHTLLERSSTPQEFITPLSLALSKFNKVELDGLDWKTSATEPVAPNTDATVPAQVLTLKAHLNNGFTSTRASMEYLDQFKYALEKLGYQVTITNRPLDFSPQGSLSSLQDNQDNGRNIALKLVWRPAA